MTRTTLFCNSCFSAKQYSPLRLKVFISLVLFLLIQPPDTEVAFESTKVGSFNHLFNFIHPKRDIIKIETSWHNVALNNKLIPGFITSYTLTWPMNSIYNSQNILRYNLLITEMCCCGIAGIVTRTN